MSLVRVKEKFQLTLPNELRQRAGVAVGDYLEASIGRGGVITLTPKAFIDRRLAEGLADIRAGRVHGPSRMSHADRQRDYFSTTTAASSIKETISQLILLDLMAFQA
jgi:bifunctional DNA-binding transcriptional regulator/antitoxin component of YhaV-PrlF toxin-antitoxin module